MNDDEQTTDKPWSPDWERDCLHWRGRILTGAKGHWCPDWDELPIDETCENEWPCICEKAGDLVAR